MSSFKKPNMSQFNNAMNKAKSELRQFESKSNRAINDLKRLERQIKSYQNKLRSSSMPSIEDAPSLYLGNTNYSPDDYYTYGTDETKEYDVFISHASEDKADVARPLAYALEKNGLAVWYDEFEMRIGDSLRRKIDKGIANSNFGIIVISRDFISKGWTNYELDGLITRSVGGKQQLLPIWHNITKKEIMDYCPSILDKIARSTTEFTVEEIADEIADVITDRKS